MDPILGQIILWPIPWVPAGWALCDGRLLPVSEYAALYSLIGNKYGGSPNVNFALPDLRSLVPIGAPTVTGVATKSGAVSSSVTATGAGSVTIGVNNLPAHTHAASFNPSGSSATVNIGIPAVVNPASTTANPGSTVSLAQAQATGPDPISIYSSDNPNTTLKPFGVSVPSGGGTVSVANTGSGQTLPISVSVPVTVSTLQPSLTLNYIIAVTGVYPTRP